MSTIAQQLGLLPDLDPDPIPVEADFVSAIAQRRTALGRKFEATDMDHELRAFALDYLGSLDAAEGFLADMQKLVAEGRTLSDGQTKGVLNWASAQKKSTAKQSLNVQSIPEGRYALDTDDGLRFYRVRKGKGRWEGYTFINRVVGSPGDFRSVHTTREESEHVASAIILDLKGAALLFAEEHGVCARCAAALTDDLSRQRSFGPDCWEYVKEWAA